MATNLDRELQKKILENLEAAYPYWIATADLRPMNTPLTAVEANITYLCEHGLIETQTTYSQDRPIKMSAKISAQGLDFLADDGGLSAILGVVTVRLHDDTIRDMIELKISQADLAPADKKKWTDGLRSLPADSIKHLTMELLTKGLEKAPDVLQLLQRYIPS